jgi:hypothetical protein
MEERRRLVGTFLDEFSVVAGEEPETMITLEAERNEAVHQEDPISSRPAAEDDR